MKKIIEWLTDVGKDKWIHFTVCLIVSLLAGIVTKSLYPNLCPAEIACVSWVVGYMVGLGKEIYDEIKTKSSDPYDWAADLIGATLGTVVVLLFVI